MTTAAAKSKDGAPIGGAAEATTRGVGHRQPSRIGKHLVSAHIDRGTLEALRKLLLKVSYETGVRATVQDAIRLGLGLFFQEYGVMPPAELEALFSAGVSTGNSTEVEPLAKSG
jgi:hypothetical protein